MKYFRNPHWWTAEDDFAWERMRTALKQGWEQCQPQPVVDAEVHRLRTEPPYDPEPAYRFGYAARRHFARKHPNWSEDVEKHARADWFALYPSRAANWEAD